MTQRELTRFGVSSSFLRRERRENLPHDESCDGEDWRRGHDHQRQFPTIRERKHKTYGQKEQVEQSSDYRCVLVRFISIIVSLDCFSKA